MGVTYTTAAERDRQRAQPRTDRFDLARLALAVTSAVAILAITLAYLGRISVFEKAEDARAGVQAVNLNTVADPGRLESAMETVFRDVNDRRFASQELFRFLVERRNEGGALPNVGAIARANVQAASIDAFDEIRRRLIERGASDEFVTDFGAILSVFFRDPDGLEGEVCVANPDAVPGVTNPPGTPAARYASKWD